MTLAMYADQIADCMSYDHELDMLGEVEDWEARQPVAVPVAKRRSRAVMYNSRSLKAATKEDQQESLADEFPDLFTSKWTQAAQEKAISDELGEMVQQTHERRPLKPDTQTLQFRYYKLWRRAFIQYGELPTRRRRGLDSITWDWLCLLFPAETPEELATVFGFGDYLPPSKRLSPSRELYLSYRGFVYDYERDLVRADHEKMPALIERERVRRQVKAILDARQDEIDRLVESVQADMRYEEWYRQIEAARVQQAQTTTARIQSRASQEQKRTTANSAVRTAHSSRGGIIGAIVKIAGKAIRLCEQIFSEPLDREPP